MHFHVAAVYGALASSAPWWAGACCTAVTPVRCWPSNTAAFRWACVCALGRTNALPWSGCCVSVPTLSRVGVFEQDEHLRAYNSGYSLLLGRLTFLP